MKRVHFSKKLLLGFGVWLSYYRGAMALDVQFGLWCVTILLRVRDQ